MDDVEEPPIKKQCLKTNDAKCAKCKKFIRKTKGAAFYINSRKEAEDFNKKYSFFVQKVEVICSKCRSILRNLTSKQRQNIAVPGEEQTLGPANNDVDTSDAISNAIEMQEHIDNLSISNDSLPEVEASSNRGYSNETDSQSSTQESRESSSQSSNNTPGFVPPSKPEVKYILMPFSRVVVSHRYCFMCKCTEKIQDVPFEARMQVFIARKIFIPQKNKCCSLHLLNKRFYDDEVEKIQIYSKDCEIAETELSKFMDKLSDKADSTLHDQMGTYVITEERIKVLTGYTLQNIKELESMMKSMRTSDNRNILQALVLFLFKMRTGNSNRCISAIFGLQEQQVKNIIDSVLKCFEEDILPVNFGFDAHNREFFLAQTAEAAKRLHDSENDTLYIICDGTYLRHQKSSNNGYQRKSYSGQKKVPLCKPFTVATTNGYVMDEPGPFTANLNDAQILKLLLDKPNGLKRILKKGDVFILDRGFRDIVDWLTEQGFTVLMPALKGKRSQLTTQESNWSRLVTKLRWVVEAIHGIIGQKFKLLHHQFYNASLPKAGLYCKIACFLNNRFGKRLNSDVGLLDEIIQRINLTKNLENTLAAEVRDKNWNQKKLPFQKLSSNELLDFPEMTKRDMKVLFTGSYQLSQSVSYLAEMLQDNNTLMLSYAKEDPDIVRFEIRSRHINSKTYKCYIHYCPETVGINGIKRYCCSCANGNRTVGCCSHVAAVIFYLSHARYLSRIINPARILTDLFDYEEVEPVIEDNSEEED